MERSDVIKQLAEAWEKLGAGRYVRCRKYDLTFYRNDVFIAHMFVEGTDSRDTDDATPALAILRDVKGEDWEVPRFRTWVSRNGEPSVEDWAWQAVKCTIDGYVEQSYSTISRLHAVLLGVRP